MNASSEQTGETKSNQECQNIPTTTTTSTTTKSQGKKRTHQQQLTGELATNAANSCSPVANTTSTVAVGERFVETPTVEPPKETRSRGRPRKTKKNNVDMIYEAVVDAAKTGANVVITDDQDCAEKTLETLPKDNTLTVESTNSATNAAEKAEVVPPLRIVVGSKRGFSGRPPGRPKKKRRKMTPRKVVVTSDNKSGNSSNSAPTVTEESSSVFESETMPDADNLTEAVSAVVREEKLSVFGEYLEGSELGENHPGREESHPGAGGLQHREEAVEPLPATAGQFRPQATSSQSSYPGYDENEELEPEMAQQEAEAKNPFCETNDYHHQEPEEGADVEHDTFPEDAVENDIIDNVKRTMALTSSSSSAAVTVTLAHGESGMELCDSSLETRSPSGCTPDTDATDATDGPSHDSDSGIGRDAGLSEQESMDKSHNSDTPNIFDAHSSAQTPESDTRELIMEDMSCQTGDDLLENGNEADDPAANENQEEEEHENEANHVVEENDTEATTKEDLQPEDQPMNAAEPAETQPQSEVTNQVADMNGGDLPDALDEVEEVDAANNNDILDGHDDSEATEEGKKTFLKINLYSLCYEYEGFLCSMNK